VEATADVVISEPDHCHREPCAAGCGDLNPEHSRTEKSSPESARNMRNIPVWEYLQTPQFIDRIYPVSSIRKASDSRTTNKEKTPPASRTFAQIVKGHICLYSVAWLITLTRWKFVINEQ